MTEWDQDDQRWADVELIAAAVKQHIKNRAYIHTGGSDGCASCKDRSMVERFEAGHAECAREGVAWDTAQGLARSLADFDLDIAISRALDDPRLFQWAVR